MDLHNLEKAVMEACSSADTPVVVELPDGGRSHITEVKEVDGLVVLVSGDWYEEDDCAEGSYGGVEDAAQMRQDAVQGSIVDRAGLSDLHR